jgi:hypothetical protein
MKVLKVLGWILGVFVALAVVAFFGARFHDGPLGPIPGGPLRSGELFQLPVSDWSFAVDVGEIELQLESQDLSRTTWILVKDGAAYVPCSLGTPPGKTWYVHAQQDGRATLRIQGKRYPVTLTQDDAPNLAEFARAEVTRKYKTGPPGGGGAIFFKVTSRAASGG